MPFKDPEKRKQAQRDWRMRRSAPYMKWLYDRRKLRFEKADRFREALEDVATLIGPGQKREVLHKRVMDARAIINEVLGWADQQEREVGNRFDHENDRPFFGGSPGDENRVA